MTVFLTLVLKLLPLYVIMACGFVAGRKTENMAQSISYIQINLVAPVVMAISIGSLQMQREYMILPFLFMAVCSAMAGLMFMVGRMWHDNTQNLIGFISGSANTGYFGIPVALLLFPEKSIGLFMLTMLGFQIYENTLGYYLIARGHYTVKDSLKRLMRLPTLYGCVAGILLSAFEISIPDLIAATGRDLRSTYIVLGALMIGLGLSKVQSLRLDGRFLGVLLGAKFILWPLAVYGLIVLDTHMFGWFTDEVHRMMFLLAIVPLPANAVAFATLLDVQPQKAATAVFISTVIALFYIPAILMWMGWV